MGIGRWRFGTKILVSYCDWPLNCLLQTVFSFFLHGICRIFLQQEINRPSMISVTSDTLFRQLEMRCTAGRTVRWYR